MKSYVLILGKIVVAGAFFAGGWYVGHDRRILSDVYAIPVIDKHLTEESIQS